MLKKPEISREELAALRTLSPDEVIERYGGTLDSIPMGIWQRLDERQVEGLVGMYMERKVSFSTDGKGKGKGRPRQTELPSFPAGEPQIDWTPEQYRACIEHYERQMQNDLSMSKPEELKQKSRSQPGIEDAPVDRRPARPA